MAADGCRSFFVLVTTDHKQSFQGHSMLPKIAATPSNDIESNRQHLIEWSVFDKYSGISYFKHPHTHMMEKT